MSVASGFQKVATDIFELCELQMQLISVDSQAAKRKLAQCLACAAVALMLAGSGLTVLLFGAAMLTSELTTLTDGAAFLLVAVVVFSVVGLLSFIAYRSIRSAVAAMEETKSEFAENLRWLKATLISPSRSPRNQFRRDSFQSASQAPPPRQPDRYASHGNR